MKGFTLLKDYIDLDGERYWHYTFGGKYTCTKFIVWDGIHYYNSNTPPSDDKVITII